MPNRLEAAEVVLRAMWPASECRAYAGRDRLAAPVIHAGSLPATASAEHILVDLSYPMYLTLCRTNQLLNLGVLAALLVPTSGVAQGVERKVAEAVLDASCRKWRPLARSPSRSIVEKHEGTITTARALRLDHRPNSRKEDLHA